VMTRIAQNNAEGRRYLEGWLEERRAMRMAGTTRL